MARRPFLSGNYGSALGSYDTAAKLLAQAGQTQGAAMAGLGANIGGAIEKYQLNKEKREQSEAAATGTIQGMMQNNPQALQSLSQDPKFAKAMERIQTDQASPKDFSLINSATAAYKVQQNAALEQENARAKNDALRSQTVITDLQGELDRRTKDDKEEISHLKAWMQRVATQKAEWELKRDKARNEDERKVAERELRKLDLQIEGLEGANREGSIRRKLLKDTHDHTVKKVKAEAESAKVNVLIDQARPDLIKAQTALTQMQALGQNIENQAEETGKKYTVGEVVTKKGSDYIWTGNTLQPIAGQITQATLDSAALRIWGDELLLYYQDTRDDQTGEIDDPSDIDPKKERLLIMMKMGTLDDIEGIEDDELKNKLKLEIEGLLATPESPPTGGATDRVKLARQALQDPNATPQEKEQAKRILQMAGQ